MTKKKILTLALAAVLVITAVAGASFAYLKDDKSATNTFTIGNVKIELNEQQVGENGELEEFEQDKKLMPGTDSVNAVDKIVTVENTGSNDAWVWVDLYIPKALVSKEYPSDESKNALHWNTYGYFNVEYTGNYTNGNYGLALSDGIVDRDGKVTDTAMVAVEDGLWYDFVKVGEEKYNGVDCVVIRSTMQNTLPSGKTSLPALAQVYMDWRVKTDDAGENYILPDGTSVSTDFNWNIGVQAYAIQADGIKNVDDAIKYYNDNNAQLTK